MTTQANHKRNMRDSEEWRLNAEKYCFAGVARRQPISWRRADRGWKKITFNDFHDLAAGSGIGIIYKEAQQDYDQVRWADERDLQKALKTLAAASTRRSPRSVPVLVFNPLAWERSGLSTVDVQLPAPQRAEFPCSTRRNRVVPSQMLSKSDAKTNSITLLIEAEGCAFAGLRGAARRSRQQSRSPAI